MDEGVRFTNGYVAHGVSGPSRAAIMTGRAPARFGVYSNTDAQDGIPLTETFLPELFQNHGYYTAAVGKWHLSKISNVPVPEDKQTRDYHDNFTTFSAEEWQPQNRGFDYFMGFHAAGTAYYNSPSLFKNRERVPAKGYISDQLTDEAIGVVDRAKTLDQPFMLYLAYNAPHLPNDNPAPEQYQKQFNTGSQTADNYYASVYSVDQGVKRILEQLKKNGQYDNTIILFTSDNGAVIDGPLPLNGAQKGYKSQTYPGGTHTPMFMWWKGKLQPGNYDKLISAMDFYPTALDAADISIPKDLKLDGVSLLPWLQDKKQGEPHKNLTWITSYSHWFDEENIPFWDNYHKFVRHQSDDYPHNPNTEDLSQFSYTVRNNDYSLVYTVENNQLGLYKLTDLQQKDNLAAANPQVVKEMQGVVREFIDNSQPPLSEVNQEKFVALITRYLGSIKHSDSPLAAGKPLTRATDNASVTVKEQNEPVAQVSQWKRYNSRTPVILATRMALDAFNVALAKDLRINIREQASGAYSVSSRLSVDPQAKDISHLLAFTCQPERHDELLTLANEVMVKRLAKGISEQELNEYQQNVQRSLDIQQRSVQQLANTIVNSLIQYNDPAAWIEQEQLLKQMTVENVNTVVKQYLSHPVNTYTGVLLPK